jgi:hypothetical protein
MLELIINADGTHLDHGLSSAVVEYILNKYNNKNEFFIDTFTLPEHLGTLECALRGPIMGDSPIDEEHVHYTTRGNRTYASRMICRFGYGVLATTQVTVIAGPHDGHACVLYTAFGGPLAPKEPKDQTIKNEQEQSESNAFWAQHALAV